MTIDPAPTAKTHTQENFPVASWLIRAEHRPIILAFYRFARAADDVADDPALAGAQKILRLDEMESILLGEGDPERAPEAARLGASLRERGLSPRHAQDLLTAFRIDASKTRYADWDELIAYCTLSAMPVGRFVLDVHGESSATWAASDALCAALQIINHLQDCGEDFRNLDRVYLPMDLLAAYKVSPEALGAGAACEPLRSCIVELADNVAELLGEGAALVDEIVDRRLRLEVSVIHALAVQLTARLKERDPLSQPTHLGRFEAMRVAGRAICRSALRGLGGNAASVASGSRI